jgi:hypothetical protein
MLLAPILRELEAHAAGSAETPKRVVFLLQSQGLQSWAVQPEEIVRKDKVGVDRVVSRPISGLTLAADCEPLKKYQDRLTIVQGLNGHHVYPYHGGPYGALGGFLKGQAPIGRTIDCALAQALPAVFPLVGLGIGQYINTTYCSSAWGVNRAAPVMCKPEYAHKVLFGSVMEGADRNDFDSRTSLLDFVKDDVRRVRGELAGTELDKFDAYLDAYENMSRRQRQLRDMEHSLKRAVPKKDDRYTTDRETLQLEAHVELAAAALIGGLTRVVTIASGLCGHFGSFRGFTDEPIEMHAMVGHNQGGRGKELYSTLRRYHLTQLALLADKLAAVPEGDGTMLDNTLIVYTSDFGETHHSTGDDWAFVLLGDLGGKLKKGRYVDYPLRGRDGNRSINALYCTLLHAAGAPCDHFNLDGLRKTIDRPGPLPELLA